MSTVALQCPRCLGTIDLRPSWNLCAKCDTTLLVEVFPALYRQQAPGQSGEVLLVEGEAGCFYHPAKKAVLPCQGCGRFLCALCDCELNGQHFCPTCLELGKTKGKIKNLANRRTPYEGIALALTIYPMITLIFWFFTIVTAPIAMYIVIRHWKAPASPIYGTRWRFVLAMLIACVEVFVWIFVFFGIFSAFQMRALD